MDRGQVTRSTLGQSAPPKFVHFLSGAARVSTRPQLRKASPKARLLAAAIVYLKALSEHGPGIRAFVTALHDILLKAKGFDRWEVFEPLRAAADAKVSPSLSSSRIFAEWIGADAPGSPLGWIEADERRTAEEAYRHFILNEVWTSETEQKSNVLGLRSPALSLLRTVFAPGYCLAVLNGHSDAPISMRNHQKSHRNLVEKTKSGDLAENLSSLATIDRSLEKALLRHPTVHHPQFGVAKEIWAMRKVQSDLGHRKFERIVLVGRDTSSPPSSSSESFGPDTVVICTEVRPESPGSLADIDLGQRIEGLNERSKQRLLFALLRSMGASEICDAGSSLFKSLPQEHRGILDIEFEVTSSPQKAGNKPKGSVSTNALTAPSSRASGTALSDLAVLVTIHNETEVAARAIASADRAVARARSAGVSVQCVIGMDAPTKKAVSHLNELSPDGWEILEFDNRDQGTTRNDLVAATNSRWVAFLDGDDLFCENWLADGALALAGTEREGERAIYHPELNFFFGDGQEFVANVDQSDPFFFPEYFYFGNYYDALCIAPREAYIEHPFRPREVHLGYALEDWHWSIETMASGWRHRVLPDTVVCKRRRQHSQSQQVRTAGSVVRQLSAMQIDQVSDLGATALTPLS